MTDKTIIPTFEQLQTAMSQVDRMYHIDNVTFCSDRSMYAKGVLENPESADFWFNHLDFNGTVYVMKIGDLVATMKHTPRICGREAFRHQFELFRKYMGAEIAHSDAFLVSIAKPKGQFSTYGHENGANRLTFVFDEPNPSIGKTSLYKIHTVKLRYETRIEGDRSISQSVPEPISPLEIISREGEN